MSPPDPHADTLQPLDAIVVDLVARQAGGLHFVTIDDTIDMLLDARNDIARRLEVAELERRAALAFDPTETTP